MCIYLSCFAGARLASNHDNRIAVDGAVDFMLEPVNGQRLSERVELAGALERRYLSHAVVQPTGRCPHEFFGKS